jgi:hypothetical protein
LPGSDHIPAELIQAGGEILRSEIHKFISSIWNKEELPDQWKDSGDETDCRNYRGISLLSTSYKIVSNILLSRLSPYIDEITCVGFDVTNQLLIRFFYSSDAEEKMGAQ